jgi:hypothetical protein
VLPEEKRKIGRKKTQPTKKAREAEPRISRRGWKRVNARRRKKTKSFNMDEQDGKSNLNLSCALRIHVQSVRSVRCHGSCQKKQEATRLLCEKCGRPNRGFLGWPQRGELQIKSREGAKKRREAGGAECVPVRWARRPKGFALLLPIRIHPRHPRLKDLGDYRALSRGEGN